MFHGRTYRYPTPACGVQTIGVAKVLGAMYGVVWIKANGSRQRIKSNRLPVTQNPSTLQRQLDAWAVERNLEEAHV